MAPMFLTAARFGPQASRICRQWIISAKAICWPIPWRFSARWISCLVRSTDERPRHFNWPALLLYAGKPRALRADHRPLSGRAAAQRHYSLTRHRTAPERRLAEPRGDRIRGGAAVPGAYPRARGG